MEAQRGPAGSLIPADLMEMARERAKKKGRWPRFHGAPGAKIVKASGRKGGSSEMILMIQVRSRAFPERPSSGSPSHQADSMNLSHRLILGATLVIPGDYLLRNGAGHRTPNAVARATAVGPQNTGLSTGSRFGAHITSSRSIRAMVSNGRRLTAWRLDWPSGTAVRSSLGGGQGVAVTFGFGRRETSTGFPHRPCHGGSASTTPTPAEGPA